MESILLLLVLFSLSAIVGRLGHKTLFSRLLMAPSFLIIGFTMGESGLGILRSSTLLSLDLFTQIAISWLAFLLGLRSISFGKIKIFYSKLEKFFYISATILLTFLVIFISSRLELLFELSPLNFGLPIIPTFAFMSVLLMGREMHGFYIKRINSITFAKISLLAVFIYIVFLIFWQTKDIYFLLTQIAVGIFVVFINAVIFWLISLSMKEKAEKENIILILLALCALISGISLGLALPHIILAFCLGYIIGFQKKMISPVLQDLFLSEQSVFIVLMILIGAQVQVILEPILWGAIIAFSLIVFRLFVHFLMKNNISEKASFASFMGTSEISILYISSLWFSLGKTEKISLLMLFVIVACSIYDFFGVLRWYYGHFKYKKSPKLILKSKNHVE